MDIDDLLNGLNTKPQPGPRRKAKQARQSTPRAAPRASPRASSRASPAPPVVSASRTPATPSPFGQRKKYLRVPKWLVFCTTCYIIGTAWAMHLAERGPDNPTTPQATATSAAAAPGAPAETVTVTVTKTVTVTDLPESCRRAIVLMRSIIEDVSQLNSRSGTQLDIVNDASQAIYQKDWVKLHEVQERQIRLSQTQESAYQDFKSKYQPALDALTQCEKDAK